MRTPDLPGAVERLRTELDARSFAPADVVPVLSYMTVGDLRTILAALDARPEPSPHSTVDTAAALAWLDEALENVDQFPDHFRMATPSLGHLRALRAHFQAVTQ